MSVRLPVAPAYYAMNPARYLCGTRSLALGKSGQGQDRQGTCNDYTSVGSVGSVHIICMLHNVGS